MGRKFWKSKRGIVGIEAAIVMIAFVVIAAAFAFMVVNMGLFSTQRSQEAIQQGLKEASCPLTIDGSILLKSSNQPNDVQYIIIPLKTLGVKYVPMWTNETVVSIKIGTGAALANIYAGIKHKVDPTGMSFDEIITRLTTVTETITTNSSGYGQLSLSEGEVIVPESVKITVVDGTEIQDKGNGTLHGTQKDAQGGIKYEYNGTINYVTGSIQLYNITETTPKPYGGSAIATYDLVVNSVSITGEKDTVDAYGKLQLDHCPVVPGSVKITIGETVLTDIGNGTLSGGGNIYYHNGTVTGLDFGEKQAVIDYEYVVETKAVLVVENDNNDDSLDFFEKGYLIIELDESQRAAPRDNVLIEIRPEKSAPLTVSFTVPEAIPANSYVTLE